MRYLCVLILLTQSTFLFAQSPSLWHLLSFDSDSVPGIGWQQYKRTLEPDTAGKEVIVAVIDGGLDIDHPDLAGKIWMNPQEIPGNQLDDDQNGYIDDVNGWNYMGNMDCQTLEVTREYVNPSQKGRKYKRAIDSLYQKKCSLAGPTYELMVKRRDELLGAQEALADHLQKEDIFYEDLKELKPNKKIKSSLLVALSVHEPLVSSRSLHDLAMSTSSVIKNYKNKIECHCNTNFAKRSKGIPSGNGVLNIGARHGTHVSGIIGAIQDNQIGTIGIAEHVKIMPLRVVPEGDEYDEHVARAIRYAVDNGAKVINMSFGKRLSPKKHLVDEAIRYADSFDVLLVHSAGNDRLLKKKNEGFPTNSSENILLTSKWLEVGSIDSTLSVSRFSNFGRNVDVYAPGSAVLSLSPQRAPVVASGTSMAAPMVSGVAAVLKSHFPQLEMQEIKEVILKSARRIKNTAPREGSEDEIKILNLYDAFLEAERRTVTNQ